MSWPTWAVPAVLDGGPPRGTILLVTLGCKVNQYDSAALAEALRGAGWAVLVDERGEPPLPSPDVVVINSCAVTARAAAKSRQAARSLARRYPGCRVVLAGCYPQIMPDEAAAVGGLAAIAGTGRAATLTLLESLACAGEPGKGVASPAAGPERAVGLPGEFEALPALLREGRVRAYLKVQEGCEAGCAYCVVPLARGLERSRTLASCLEEARRLLRAGARELVLTGIRLGAYGRDLPGEAGLSELLRQVGGLHGLVRLRLSSLEPIDLDSQLLGAIAGTPMACRHLHLPLQSGSDTVLRRMGRGYDTAKYAGLLDAARKALPGVAVSTDIMVGFPGETDSEHEASMAFVRESAFSRLHVFPYSARPGTAAAAMPGQLPRRLKEVRAKQFIALGSELAARYHKGLLGRTRCVLLETESHKCNDDTYQTSGLTEDYVRAGLRLAQPVLPGTLAPVVITSATAEGVEGHLAPGGISCRTQCSGESCNR